jgi:uncharacterized protein with PIN domain
MRFVVDVMLGKLAKWLRIMGYDVLYSNTCRDEELARIAAAEGRCLLTRDRELLSRFRLKHALFVRSVRVTDQLRELSCVLDLACRPPVFSRCTACNAEIHEVEREDVAEEVPEYVYLTSLHFYRCGGCRKVYWPGTHVARMEEQLREIFGRSF